MFGWLRRFRWARGPRWFAASICLLLAAASAIPPAHRAAGNRSVVVVVASRALAAGHTLAAGDVRTARWPASLRPDASYSHRRQVLGERLAGALAAHEPITARRLVGSRLTEALPAGLVAADAVLAGDRRALVHPGERIDLLAVPGSDVADPAAASGASVSARKPVVVMRHALVLAAYASVTYASTEPATDVVLAATVAQATNLVELSATSRFAAVAVPP